MNGLVYEAFYQGERLSVKRQGLFAVLLGCVVSRKMGPVELLGKEPEAEKVQTVKDLKKFAKANEQELYVYMVEESTGMEIEVRRMCGGVTG